MSATQLQTLDRSNHSANAHPSTLVLCDLTESTALYERLGDQAATELVRRHDRFARFSIQSLGGREIDKTDGFLVLFERPIQAVAFALTYQRGIRSLSEETGQPLNARVGIHFGEVVVWENDAAGIANGAKPREVEGVAKAIAARLMSLARPGQILLSDAAEAMARRAEREFSLSVRWLAHGQYHLKGMPLPVAVYEVGEAGVAPLRAPPASAKAWPLTPSWRRPRALAGAGIVFLVAALGTLHILHSDESTLAFSDRDWIVVGDFVNVNGDPKFDAALDTAFRIGISESRFVNVVPDVSVRQALARMQRDRATHIDRQIGSEIAMRENARAVIVPSMFQTGQSLRLVAEVIDPNGARTVSTETSDANGPGEILAAMDRLLQKARHHLGESLQQIQATSQPLERVATPNFEALRVLSSALAMERDGELEQAEKLHRHAIELDPNFATAYRTLGSVLVQQERYAEGRVALEKALSIDGRLTERERLFTRAFLTEFADPASALSQWRAFAVLYPGNGTGQHNAGAIYYSVLHDYPAAESALVEATVPRNPFLNYTLQLLGAVQLASEKFEDADQQFRAALKFSPTPIAFGLSDVLAARGRFEEAARYLDETKRSSLSAEVERSMRRATLLIAQGELPAATVAIETALSLANGLGSPNARWRAQAAMIALRTAQGDSTAARSLVRAMLRELSREAEIGANLTVIEELLYAGAWAARLGLTTEAAGTLAIAQRHGALDKFPVRARLAATAQAEIDLFAGRANAALARLQPQVGSELWEAHELRARALRVRGDSMREIVELQWLVSHSGRAYAQRTDHLLGQQARVLDLREAKVRLANASQPR